MTRNKPTALSSTYSLYTLLFLILTICTFLFITSAPVRAQYSREMEVTNQVIIPSGSEEVISNTRIIVKPSGNTKIPAFVISSGAVLKINENSLIDLSRSGNYTVFQVEEGGKLILQNSEMSGAAGSPDEGFIIVNGGELEITDSIIQNNYNDHKYKYFDFFANNLIVVRNGKFSMKGSKFQNNSGRNNASYTTHIRLMDSEAVIDGSEFTENTGIEILHLSGSSLLLKDSFFKANTVRNAYSSLIMGIASDITIAGGNAFIDNQPDNKLPGSIIFVTGSTLNIEENNTFTGNGLCLQTSGSITHIKGSLFSSNESFIKNSLGGIITIQDSVIEKCSSRAIEYHHESYNFPFTHFSFELPPITSENRISIENSNFLNNQGGALSTFDLDYRYKDLYGTVIARITDTEFTGNTAVPYSENPFTGAAIYIGASTHAYIDDLTITENSASGYGGGIAVGQFGKLMLHPRHGATIFSNHAAAAEKNIEDIYVIDRNTAQMITEKTGNGLPHNWGAGDPISAVVRDHILVLTIKASYADLGDNLQEVLEMCEIDPVIYRCGDDSVEVYNWEEQQFDVEGYSLGASPQSQDIPENTSVLIKNNSVSGTDTLSAHGGGIAVNGILESGEEAVSLMVRKIWDLPAGSSLPSPEAFVAGLKLTVNGEVFDPGTVTLESGSEDQSTFQSSADPWLRIRVDKNQEGIWDILYEDLPKYINGTEAVYEINEVSEVYDAVISGNMTEGFTITNTLKPVPTEVPTAVPTEEPDREWFRLLREQDALPQTGITD